LAVGWWMMSALFLSDDEMPPTLRLGGRLCTNCFSRRPRKTAFFDV
jgi:hypothetical protein